MSLCIKKTQLIQNNQNKLTKRCGQSTPQTDGTFMNQTTRLLGRIAFIYFVRGYSHPNNPSSEQSARAATVNGHR